MARRSGPRFCRGCDDGVADGRAYYCQSCQAERHRAAARRWWARNKRSRAGEPRRERTPAQIARHRLLALQLGRGC